MHDSTSHTLGLQVGDKARALDASLNRIEEVPAEIATLPNLTVLNVGCNALLRIDPAIATLTRLKTLVLDRNPTMGSLPGILCGLTSLQVLQISDW